MYEKNQKQKSCDTVPLIISVGRVSVVETMKVPRGCKAASKGNESANRGCRGAQRGCESTTLSQPLQHSVLQAKRVLVDCRCL
jgi:hypothetical protein